ncbi:BtrH N-terminal domain-containing protein [Kitasatospora sp. NPDC057223]|uniref:BtrH N-terminal domain-containing protein n=1 Tax=Kitasatospora sp. NPDC057223 TaxID=3346055 RepID=UPI0036251EC4
MTVSDSGPLMLGGPIELWYRDVVSCLQSTLATVLLNAGHDPLPVLGAHWEFLFQPGTIRSEEFYFPCRHEGDPAHSIAPAHPLTSRWLRPAAADDPFAEIRDELAAGRPVIAAVDNFHLPFRPAFGDVHAAHLIVVTGLDEERGLIRVSDAQPPAFAGTIEISAFLNAWSSANPHDVQDAFFSDSVIDRRLLAVRLGDDFPKPDAEFLAAAIDDNLRLFAAEHDPAGLGGLAGVRAFTEGLVDGAAAGDASVLRDAYPFGWGMQAQAALHGEFLRGWGAEHDVPALREAARRVEAVAHAWTGVRVTSAHGRDTPAAVAADLARHAMDLRQSYEIAVDCLHHARGQL